jgi:predicted TIM-barrel fold metal-dependent hydrolase
VTTQLQVQTTPEGQATKAVTLVDVDIHPVVLPPGLAKRMPERWARHLERFGRRAPFVTDLYPRPRNKGMRADSWPEGGVPGSDYDLLRQQLLDEHDVDFGILLCLVPHDAGYEHPELDLAINRAVNDCMAEEWLDRDERLRSSILVPFEYPELAVKEIERVAADDRFVQVLLPASGKEPFGSRRYWPVYAAAAEAGLPVAFHTGGYTGHRGAGWPSFYLEEHAGYGVIMQMLLTSLVCEGTFAAIPKLKVVLTEGGALWAAALRWRLDEAYKQLRDEVPELERLPSEYIDDHVWYDTQPMEEPDDPAHFLQIVDQARLEDRLMFATDYPHWDFDAPAQALPRGLSKDQRAKIMAGTACDLYGLPKVVPVERA